MLTGHAGAQPSRAEKDSPSPRVVGGRETGRIARDYARERGLDLEASVACGGREADLLLLAAVGQPCAVNPDAALRRSAREADWPVVDYSA